MQIHHRTLFDAGALGLVSVVGADHTLRRLNDLTALDEADQSLLQLQVPKGLLLVTHAQTDHAQRPSSCKGVPLSL
jgi:hypothetical protein